MNRVHVGGGVLGALAIAIVGDLSCLSVDEPTSPIPINSCSAIPCSKYGPTPSAAACGEAGACEVAADTSRLVMVISLPSDAPLDPRVEAPSTQYVIPYDHLGDCPQGPASCDLSCMWPGCAVLPEIADISGGYVATAAVQYPPGPGMGQHGIGFFLGNLLSAGVYQDTLLPVTATYRLLETSGTGGGEAPWVTPVAALGLPVQPVVVPRTVLRQNLQNLTPGPSHGASYGYEAFLPPGTYERTLVPQPPYDAIFGPAIDQSNVVVAGPVLDLTSIIEFDPTTEQGAGTPAVPTFQVSRQDGLDGWTAYLRDVDTGRTASNIRSLSGNSATFQLLTVRGLKDPATGLNEALRNAVLVVQPPGGSPLPTGVFPGLLNANLPTVEPYPTFPPPIIVTGSITGPGDVPVDADVEFEGLAFSNGATLTDPDFEFTTTAPARAQSGTSKYTVTLPQGEYRVTVRPVVDSDTYADAGVAPALSVTTLLVDDRHTLMDFPPLPAMRRIAGTAVVADGRPLIGATVQAIPLGCDQPSSLADGGDAGSQLKHLGSTPSCLPRPQQTLVTDPAGNFSLPVDPGTYRLRVRPAEGTGFPWVTQILDPSAATVRLIVPAPFHASFQVFDFNDDPVVRALVKAFLVPDPSSSSSAQAVELGETLTDGSGQCDLYLDLAPPP